MPWPFSKELCQKGGVGEHKARGVILGLMSASYREHANRLGINLINLFTGTL